MCPAKEQSLRGSLLVERSTFEVGEKTVHTFQAPHPLDPSARARDDGAGLSSLGSGAAAPHHDHARDGGGGH